MNEQPETEVNITVDPNKLTWGEYGKLVKPDAATPGEMYDILDRIIIGDASGVPFMQVVQAISTAMTQVLQDAASKN